MDKLSNTERYNVLKKISNNGITLSAKGEEQLRKNRVLAETIAEELSDHSSLGAYIKLAAKTKHQVLYEALSWVKDYSRDHPVRKPGGLFTWKLKRLLMERK